MAQSQILMNPGPLREELCQLPSQEEVNEVQDGARVLLNPHPDLLSEARRESMTP